MLKSLLGLVVASDSSSTNTTPSDSSNSSSEGSTSTAGSSPSPSSTARGDEAKLAAAAATESAEAGRGAEVELPQPAAPQEPEIDEEAIKQAVQEYSQMERLAPFRTKQLTRLALKEKPPLEPPPGDCCGCSCDPCVKDLWREEVRVWKIARGIDPYGSPTPTTNSKDLEW